MSTTVTEIDSTQDGHEARWEITVRRGTAQARVSAADLPADVRAALLSWLGVQS